MHPVRYLKAKLRNLTEKARRPSAVTHAQHKHLKSFPQCQACGSLSGGQAHHIQPYHKYPGRATDPDNFITLCETVAGPMCHIFIGHGDDFHYYNPNVVHDAQDLWQATLHGDVSACKGIKARAKAARLPDTPVP